MFCVVGPDGQRVRAATVDRYSTEEVSQLPTAARLEHDGAIIVLLARTGLRLGAACGLRWRDVRLNTTPPRHSVVWHLGESGSTVTPTKG